MPHHIVGANVRRIALGAILIFQSACTVERRSETSPVVLFRDLFDNTHTTALAASVGSPAGALVTGSEIALLDENASDIKVFRRRDGSLARVVGKFGDDAGDFRRPVAIASLDSGRYVVFDQGRKTLSFRDSLGRVTSETPGFRGVFTGLLALPAEQRVVLSGRTYNQNDDMRDADLHEFGFDGKHVASYALAVKARSSWASRFSTLFAARIGSDVVTGTLSSNRLRFYDRATRRVRWIDVASSWYRPLQYPSTQSPGAASALVRAGAPRIMEWMHSQPFMNGVFPLTGGRFLVRFQAFTSLKDKAFYYAIADTSGRTAAVSQATYANIVATRGDTAFWVSRDAKNAMSLGYGVIRSMRPLTVARGAR